MGQTGRLHVTCPGCATVLKAPPEAVGQRVKCKECGMRFNVGDPPAGPPPLLVPSAARPRPPAEPPAMFTPVAQPPLPPVAIDLPPLPPPPSSRAGRRRAADDAEFEVESPPRSYLVIGIIATVVLVVLLVLGCIVIATAMK